MKMSLLLAVVALLAHAGTATASVARPASPLRVHVSMAACPDGGGVCTAADTATIYLDGGGSRFERQHELGHLVDVQLLDNGERNAIQRAMGTRASWWGNGTGISCYDRVCPSELFADAYATCRMGWTAKPRKIHGVWGGSWTVAYGWIPTPRQQRRTCGVITRASQHL